MMQVVYALMFFLGIAVFVIGLVLSGYRFIKKKPARKTMFFSLAGIISVIAGLTLGVATSDPDELKRVASNEVEINENKTYAQINDGDATTGSNNDSPAKVEQVSYNDVVHSDKEKDEVQADRVKEDFSSSEANYYMTNTQPALAKIQEEYDLIWVLWSNTFNELSDGTKTFAEGSQAMKVASKRYADLSKELFEIPIEGLSEDSKKEINKVKGEFSEAIDFRQEAIKLAKGMMEKEKFPAKTLNRIESILTEADADITTAVSMISLLENKLAIEK